MPFFRLRQTVVWNPTPNHQKTSNLSMETRHALCVLASIPTKNADLRPNRLGKAAPQGSRFTCIGGGGVNQPYLLPWMTQAEPAHSYNL